MKEEEREREGGSDRRRRGTNERESVSDLLPVDNGNVRRGS